MGAVFNRDELGRAKGTSTDPNPPAQAVLIKFLLETVPLFPDILNFSFYFNGYKRFVDAGFSMHVHPVNNKFRICKL